jgi:hypothetical protein
MPRQSVLLILVLLQCVPPVWAQKEKKSQRIPDVIATARYVYISTVDGELTKPSVSQQDRKAASALTQYLQEWGRYKVALRPQDAEIILVVSSGRAELSAGAGTGGRRGTGGSARTPEDTMLIYDARLGVDSAALWRRSQIDGFVGGAPLFDVFKRDVEAAAKQVTEKEAAKKK